jgi:hypothetical protein
MTDSSEKTVTVIALGLSLVLAGIMVYEWQWGERFQHEVSKVHATSAKAAAVTLLPEFSLPSRTTYSETLTRPIFAPSRRGNLADNTGRQQMKKGQFALSGVIIVPGQRLALLRDVTTGKSERVEQGQEIRGMLAERVDASEVELKQGNETEVLTLVVQRTPAPQPAPQQGGTSAQPLVKPPGVESVTVSEPVRRLDTDEQRLAEIDRRRQQQLETYKENNRIRAEKGLPLLPIPESLLAPARKP